MEKEHDLFLRILIRLDKEKILPDIIIIGGWCPLVYKEYFGNPIQISMQRTADLDFLVPNPTHIDKDVNVPIILEGLGFDRKISPLDGYEKYVHPNLEIEFLTPEKGRGRSKPYTIDKLHINAQGLRYLALIQDHVVKASYNGVPVNVPEPAAYVLHKFILSGRRQSSFKREKDIATAIQLGEYLLGKDNQIKKMREIYLSLPDKWKRDLLRIVKYASENIYTFLTSIED